MTPGFDSESLAALIDTSQAAANAGQQFAIVPITQLNQVALVDRFEKKITYEEVAAPKRAHKLLSIQDVVAWSSASEDSPIVWIGNDAIVITLDAKSCRVRGDQAVYTWRPTPEFTLMSQLSKMNDNDAFRQADLLKLLKTTLWNNFNSNDVRDSLIKSLRNVVAQQTSSMTQGKGTYEASMATNTGVSENWPERFAMNVRVYEDTSLATTEEIDVVFDVNASNKTFSLWPTSASLMVAQTAVREHASELIRDQLKDTGVNVFAGSPS